MKRNTCEASLDGSAEAVVGIPVVHTWIRESR